MNAKIIREKLLARDGNSCHVCKKPITAVPKSPVVKPHEMTIDHIVPKAKGGSDDLSNLKLAHYSCNVTKGDTLPPMEYSFSFKLKGVRFHLKVTPTRKFDLHVETAA